MWDMDSARGGRHPALPAAPGWLPLLVGGLFIHAGLVRSYLRVDGFPYERVDYWLYDVTRHWNVAAVLLGAAVLLPLTRAMGAVAVGAFAVASTWVVLFLALAKRMDVSTLTLFGPCELPIAGQLTLNLGLLAAAGWLLLGASPGRRAGLTTATAVPACAAAAFLLTAWLKLETTLNPPGCGWYLVDAAGNAREDPLYAWLWWGGRFAIPVEAAIAALLLVPRTRAWGARIGAAFVLLATSVLVALTVISGRDLTAMCGCFGPISLPLSAHLTFDGMLLGLLLWTLKLGATPVVGGESAPTRAAGERHPDLGLGPEIRT
jgi:hypothetical protein